MSPLFGRRRDRVITGWDVGAPPDWAALPLLPADGPEGESVRDAIRAVAEDHLILLGVWVPDREAGVPRGVMKAELLLDADRDAFESLVHASHPPEGQERLHLETFRVDLPAGPSVLVDHQGAVDDTLEQYLQFVVFPAGTTDAVSLAFTTTALHLVEQFAIATRDIAETLVVELGAGAPR